MANIKCSAGDICMFCVGDEFGHFTDVDIKDGDDVILILSVRGKHPILISDLIAEIISDKKGKIEEYHADCYINIMGDTVNYE